MGILILRFGTAILTTGIAIPSSEIVIPKPGTASESPDSALSEALGYTRKSERRSGLTRRKRGEPAAN